MAKRKTRNPSPSHNHLFLADISPITDAQSLFFDNYDTGKSQVLLGHSGVGKTFLSMFKAFDELNNARSDVNRIVIVRSAVPTRDVGFLPGTLQEKSEIYELPYKGICTDLFGRGDAYEVLKKHYALEFTTTSFIRGTTIDNAIVIVDEFQNMTAHEADSVLTRIGNDSKIIFCGDIMQRDFTKRSEQNIEMLLSVLESMPDFVFTEFTEDDVVRSGLVGDYLKAKHRVYPNGFAA